MEQFNKAGLLKFIDLNIEKGWVNSNTGGGWKAAVRKILEAVGPEDDLRQIDIKSEIHKYANKHPGVLSADSLNQYEKRIALALDQFVKFKKDPTTYKPIGRAPTTSKAPRKEKLAPGPSASSADSSDSPPPTKPVTGMATDTSLAMPFPLRAGFLAQIVIPRDLTKDEAVRLCAFIHTLALPPAVSVPSVATQEAASEAE